MMKTYQKTAAAFVLAMSVLLPSAQAAERFTMQFHFGNGPTWSWHGGPVYPHAQQGHWYAKKYRLNKRQIRRYLRSMGYRNIKKIRPRGDVYVVKAKWRGRKKVRLVMDAYSGWILKARYIN
ncbi:hypothetical protein [Polycladidibacter hongkongensis]|uniref:hypothetical protein n=1 Tax=Polycladidibacter hongkongensis TaxID=1647556 RepID=UPI000832862F|nr:hypothetical protein [Pseudovibrio hongkongensis]